MLSLLEMSVAGAVMILAVMAVRIFAVKWLPKVTLRLLWMAVLCRLLMPLRVPSPTSIYAAAERFGRMAGKPGLLLEGRESIQAAAPNPGISPFILLWAAGTLLLAFYFVYCHMRSRRGYREALPLEHPFVKAWLERHRLRRPVRVRVSDQIGSPLTYGILWPVILLPKNLDWEDTRGLGFILAHETAHIRYFDALGKWLLAAGLCLHWFNPLVWVMYLLANRDLELSCDEAVVQEYGRDARASYALTLVGLEEHRTVLAPLESSFSRNDLTGRVTSILRSHQITAVSVGCALILVAVVAGAFATNPPGENEDPASLTGLQNAGTVQETDTSEMTTAVRAVEGAAFLQDGDDISNWPESSQEQYDYVLEALFLDGYEELSIAEFNRKVNAALNAEHSGHLMELYEIVLNTLKESDPKAAFLRNTVGASMREYYARLEEVYSGSRTDPEFWGEAKAYRRNKVLGERMESGVLAQYCFTYRILDQDSLTVGERDRFLQAVMSAAQNTLEEQVEKSGGIEAFQQALKTAALQVSDGKIEFTGCQVEGVELLYDSE